VISINLFEEKMIDLPITKFLDYKS